jgi:hypothetical protein
MSTCPRLVPPRRAFASVSAEGAEQAIRLIVNTVQPWPNDDRLVVTAW